MTFKADDKVRVVYADGWENDIGLRRYHNKTGVIKRSIHTGWAVQLDGNMHDWTIGVSERYLQLLPTVRIGDRVRCMRHIKFPDGSWRDENDQFTVINKTAEYYQWAVDRGDYEVLPEPVKYMTNSVRSRNAILHPGTFYTMTYDSLAYAIIQAYNRIDQNDQWYQSTVYVWDEKNASRTGEALFSAYRGIGNKVYCWKSDACKVTTAEIHAALKEVYACSK